ncbi:MAG: DMT family transporter [Candidatus Peribacteraceae bacterium]|nr:DMT family transporter [Candidatus Peribacteraceae bacterium]
MDFFHKDSGRRLGLMFAFGALIWSGTYNALAKGLTPFLSPMTLLLLSETLTAAFIILTFGLVPLLKKFVKMDAKSIRMAIIVGLMNSAVAPLLWFTGLSYTTAVNATMLSSAEVVSVLVLSHYILGERMTRMQITGILTVVMGIVIINVSGFGASFNVHKGDAFILLGCVSSGIGSVLFKKYLSHVMPELAIVIRNIAGIVAVGILSLLISHSVSAEVAAFPMHKVLLLLAFTFFSRYLNLTFFYEALDRLPASTLSSIHIANPLTGVLFAYLILGEHIQSYHILGGIFIIFGLMLEQMSERSLHSLKGRGWLHFPFYRRDPIVAQPTIQLLPKNV